MTSNAGESSSQPQRVAAFFDLDKTLIATSASLAFSRELFGHGLISAADAAHVVWAEVAYMVLGHTEQRMDRMKNSMMAMITGWDDEHVNTLLSQAINRVITPTIYEEAQQLLDYHRASGHDVILISASPGLVVDPVAKILGIDTVVSTKLGLRDGKYTGTIDFYCKGPRKAEAMKQIAAERGYDLSRCYAYSDSIVDLPMLSLVGFPVAVNPDRSLRRVAESHGWPTRRFKHPLLRRSIMHFAVVGTLAVVTTGAAVWALVNQQSKSTRRRNRKGSTFARFVARHLGSKR